MDFPTLTADEFAVMDADAFATMLLDNISSSSSSHGQNASSSSSQSNLLILKGVIYGHRYLTIARAYADAYEGQDAIVPCFEDALEALRCLDDVEVTTSLLGVFFDAYQQAEVRYSSTTPFLDAVQTLQRHVEVMSGLPVADWIAAAVPGGVVPYAWALLSKAAGYDIDVVIG